MKTVSNVVRGYVHVAPATKDRVERVIAELGYRPNLSARSLRGGRAGVIALAVPSLTEYFAELALCVQRAAERQGFTLLIDQTEGRADRERLVLEGIRSQLVDGLIYSPVSLGEREISRRRDPTPLVLLGERVYGGPADHVAIDNAAAGREAVEHLIGLGRRRIAAIGASRAARAAPARLRLAGYHQALVAAGLPAPAELVVRAAKFGRGDGADATRRLLATGARPDAIFAFNDELAVGAMRALHEAGLRVPDDVAVVGFDDIGESRFTVPTLTTISPEKEEIAAQAVDCLLSRVRGESDARPREIVVPHHLVVRESTLGVPRPAPGSPPSRRPHEARRAAADRVLS